MQRDRAQLHRSLVGAVVVVGVVAGCSVVPGAVVPGTAEPTELSATEEYRAVYERTGEITDAGESGTAEYSYHYTRGSGTSSDGSGSSSDGSGSSTNEYIRMYTRP